MSLINLSQNLESDYKTVYDRAFFYASVQGLKEEESEDALLNLYDLLYTAQNEGKPVERIIGNDVETFCREYFEHQTLGRFVKGLPKELLGLLRYLAIVEIIFLMGDLIFGQFPKTVDLSIYLYSWVIGSLISWELAACYDRISRTKWFSINRFYLLGFFAFLLNIFVSILLSRLWPLELSAKLVLVSAIIFLIGDISYRCYRNYRRYGNLRNPDKREMKVFKKAQNQQASNIMAVNMLKKRWKKKLAKSPSIEACQAKLAKELANEARWLKAFPWIILVIYIIALIPVILSDSLMDILIYATLQGIVVGGLGKLTYQTTKRGQLLRQ